MIGRRYHASALHLLAHGALFAAVGWVLLRVVEARGAIDVLLWLAAALVLHDLVLLPLYALLDRLAAAVTRRARVPLVNHVRVPAALSGLTLLVFFPLIAGKSDANLRYVSGIEPTGYLERWLLLAGALFAASAVVYAFRVHGLHRRAPAHVDRAAPRTDGHDDGPA
jgi:hypothetical protein